MRQIIHVDLDAFYASVEELLNPSLKGKPIVVGGRPEERGVVASASYAARKFGVRSAMPMGQALRLCPDAIRVDAHYDAYRRYSRQVMSILRQVTSLVEPLSIDEAFLDVSDVVGQHASAESLARQLQQQIRDQVGLSASFGVATNKMVAKIASDEGKPGGLVVVPPGQEREFLAPLAVRKLWGVGPRTEARLHDLGVQIIGDLARLPPETLVATFGESHGQALYRHARGQDDRPVETRRERKSLSQERTFARDVAEEARLVRELHELSAGVADDLQRHHLLAYTITLKLRRADFSTVTRSQTLPTPTDRAEVIFATAREMLDREWKRGERVRLLGVRASNWASERGYQLSLFGPSEEANG
jgi:DNA polymerase-4